MNTRQKTECIQVYMYRNAFYCLISTVFIYKEHLIETQLSDNNLKKVRFDQK